MSNNAASLPQKIRTEMYDKVNLMCRNYMDRIVRFGIDYDFSVDEAAFKAVLQQFFGKAPVFRSQVVKSPVSPYWRVSSYEIEDAVTVSTPADICRAKEEFFTQGIALDSNLQMKAALFYGDNKTSVCFIWNHMCMDLGGFKAFYATFCAKYTALVNGKNCVSDFATGTRAFDRVYDDFSDADKARAKKLFANVSPTDNHRFPFTACGKDDKVVLVTRRIDRETFEKARLFSKKAHATVNDMILACYINALRRLAGFGKDESINVTSAVDLRRYIKNSAEIGYTNHVTFIHCSLQRCGTCAEETLSLVANSTAKSKRDPFMGLHGLPLLNMGYKTMVYAQAEAVIKLFYKNPPLAVSNIGALNPEVYSLCGNSPTDAFASGAAKNKPCAMMTAVSLNGTLSLSICVRGNEEDRQIINRFFDEVEKSVSELAN